MSHLSILVGLLTLTALAATAAAEPEGFNYDESKVPNYKLPDPLTMASGAIVSDANDWVARRRPEILELFEKHVFGRSPAPRDDQSFEVTWVDQAALDGRAIRKHAVVFFSTDRQGPQMDLLIYLPVDAPRPTPLFLGLNFFGNHTIHADPDIELSRAWMRESKEKGIVDNHATEASRGKSAGRWAVDAILDRGYGLATAYCGDVDPDHNDGFQNGVHPLFYVQGQTKPAPDQWGTIAAWAWGLSRAMDYFETDEEIDSDRVAVMGHSRLGKTALWAGASDPRFSIVISNDSGCGGAALSRRRFGETVKRINTVFPHWFCDNFQNYNDREDELPVDQHMLLALIAPRPVYVASAAADRWADPRGEYLAAYHASPVYEMLGQRGLTDVESPPIDQPVQRTVGYHIRSGKHDVTDFDWKAYLDFADLHWGGGNEP